MPHTTQQALEELLAWMKKYAVSICSYSDRIEISSRSGILYQEDADYYEGWPEHISICDWTIQRRLKELRD